MDVGDCTSQLSYVFKDDMVTITVNNQMATQSNNHPCPQGDHFGRSFLICLSMVIEEVGGMSGAFVLLLVGLPSPGAPVEGVGLDGRTGFSIFPGMLTFCLVPVSVERGVGVFWIPFVLFRHRPESLQD
jgi:hypothetical protein